MRLRLKRSGTDDDVLEGDGMCGYFVCALAFRR